MVVREVLFFLCFSPCYISLAAGHYTSARREATERARVNLAAAAAAGVETLRLGCADGEGGGVDPLELVSLIAVHALERCEAHPHGDGARAFYRAARRLELAARACQPDYRQGTTGGNVGGGGAGGARGSAGGGGGKSAHGGATVGDSGDRVRGRRGEEYSPTHSPVESGLTETP